MRLHRLAGLDSKARSQRIEVGIGVDLRAINVQLSPPDQLLPAFIVLRLCRRSGGTPPLHSAHEYGSDWNGRAAAHPNRSRIGSRRGTDNSALFPLPSSE